MEERKRGRPVKFSKEHLLQMKAMFGDTKSGKRLLQNHIYQTFSFPLLREYNREHGIENFEYLYEDDTYFKQTVFTELGRSCEYLSRYVSKEEADEYIINLAKEICLLAKNENNKITSRIVERLIREDRQELKERLKEDSEN